MVGTYVLENITGSISYEAMLMLFHHGTPNHDKYEGGGTNGNRVVHILTDQSGGDGHSLTLYLCSLLIYIGNVVAVVI